MQGVMACWCALLVNFYGYFLTLATIYGLWADIRSVVPVSLKPPKPWVPGKSGAMTFAEFVIMVRAAGLSGL